MARKKDKDLQQFLLAQIAEINKYKWVESERRCYDIGFQQAAMEWIEQYSASFKEGWKDKGKDVSAFSDPSSKEE